MKNILDRYSEEEIKRIVSDFIESKAYEYDLDARFDDVFLHGSRIRGDFREDSDLDAVVHYSGSIREDSLFDILNEDPRLEIDQIAVDINPIRDEESGSMKEYMNRSREYDKEKLKVLAEEITPKDVDETIKNELKEFIRSLKKPSDIEKKKFKDKMTLIDIFDLCNFQSGGYRTIQNSDILISQACSIFGSVPKDVLLYRGTSNKNEIESIEESGKDFIGHALSFSKSKSIADGFGSYIIKVVENDNVDCLDLQMYVSTVQQALTELGYSKLSQTLRKIESLDKQVKIRLSDRLSSISILPYGITSDDFKRITKDFSLQDSMKSSRINTYQTSSLMYVLTYLFVFMNTLFHDEFISAKKLFSNIDFYVVDMGNEQEVLVPSNASFKIIDEQYTNKYVIPVKLSNEFQTNKKFKNAQKNSQMSIEINDKEKFAHISGKLSLIPSTETRKFEDASVDSLVIDRKTTVIPEKFMANAFSIKAVLLPNSVTLIDTSAFSFSNIESIDIPPDVVLIRSSAFKHCTKLKLVQFLGNQLTQISQSCFSYCSNLNSIDIPEGISSIDYGAFSECTGLKDVYFPKSLKKIAPYAFGACSALEKIEFNEGLESLGDFSFKNCHELKQILFSHTIKTIGWGSFFGCDKIEKVDLNEGLTEIQSNSFSYCGTLKEVVFPSTLKNLMTNAFFETKISKLIVKCPFSNISNTIKQVIQYSDNIDITVRSEDFDEVEKFLKDSNLVANVSRLRELQESRKTAYSRKQILEAIKYWEALLFRKL